MRKSIVKRLRKIERQTFQPRWRVVVKDYNGSYGGECGSGLSQEQFDGWVKQQDKDTQVIIVEVCDPQPDVDKCESATFKVKNYADKNTEDLLKEIEELEEKQTTLPKINIDEYSEQEKTSVLEAYRIIKEHRPMPARESMH